MRKLLTILTLTIPILVFSQEPNNKDEKKKKKKFTDGILGLMEV